MGAVDAGDQLRRHVVAEEALSDGAQVHLLPVDLAPAKDGRLVCLFITEVDRTRARARCFCVPCVSCLLSPYATLPLSLLFLRYPRSRRIVCLLCGHL